MRARLKRLYLLWETSEDGSRILMTVNTVNIYPALFEINYSGLKTRAWSLRSALVRTIKAEVCS